MSPEEFVIWMQGFVEGSNAYNLTPAGWDAIKAKLKEVNSFKEWPGMLTTEPQTTPWTYPTVPPYWYTSPSIPNERFRVTCGTNITSGQYTIPPPLTKMLWEDGDGDLRKTVRGDVTIK